jgi:putative hydrolase of the HAD superfamily
VVWRFRLANIIVDLDDTLIHTCALYDAALSSFGSLMAEHFDIGVKEAEDTARRVDIMNTPYRWVMHRFPGSLGMAYLAVAQQCYARLDVALNPVLLAQSVALGYQVFTSKAEPVDGAGDALARLYGSHRLYLYTMGERAVQQNRINQLGYANVFRDIGIVDSKDPDTLREFMRIHRMAPESTYVVGDSPRVDIAPAVEVGVTAIHIPPAQGWVYHDVDVDGDYHTLKSIKLLPGLIERLERVEVSA